MREGQRGSKSPTYVIVVGQDPERRVVTDTNALVTSYLPHSAQTA